MRTGGVLYRNEDEFFGNAEVILRRMSTPPRL